MSQISNHSISVNSSNSFSYWNFKIGICLGFRNSKFVLPKLDLCRNHQNVSAILNLRLPFGHLS